jgi:hypothetical protein
MATISPILSISKTHGATSRAVALAVTATITKTVKTIIR